RLFDGATGIAGTRQVGADDQAPPPLGLDDLPRFACVRVLFQVDDGHIGTFAREMRRDGTANAAVTTTDQCHPAFELPAAAVAVTEVRGSRMRGGFTARLPGLWLWRMRRIACLACHLEVLEWGGVPLDAWGMPARMGGFRGSAVAAACRLHGCPPPAGQVAAARRPSQAWKTVADGWHTACIRPGHT